MRRGVFVLLVVAIGAGGCAEEPGTEGSAEAVQLRHFPIEADDVAPGGVVAFDRDITQDGGGSLRIEATDGGRLRLYELDDLGEIPGQIMLTGFLRSRALRGQAMFELRCRPSVGAEAFVRGVRRHASGETGWTPQEVRFPDPSLCRDPESVQINLLIFGTGTIWVDNLRLWSVPDD